VTSHSPAKVIAALSAPLIAFFLVQNALSLATLAMVGRLGDASLAGMGLASTFFMLLLALLYGLDTGVQALTSRATGAGDATRIGQTLVNALAIPLGALLMLAAWNAGPPLLRAVSADPGVIAAGAAYLAFAAPTLLLLAITIPFNAAWIGSGRPGIAFGVTAIAAPVQVAFALWLMLGPPRMGTAGAGLAMTLASLLGLLVQILLATRWRPIPGLLTNRPERAGAALIARLGWPVSVQQSLAQVGLMVGFAIVSRLGVAEVAIVNVLATLMLVPIQTAVGMGTAAATLVGQALGRGEPDEARRWGWRVAGWGVAVIAPMSLAVLFAPAHILGAFMADPATVAMALWPARLMGLVICASGAAFILGFALRGAGATRAATAIPFVAHFLIQLPLMWWIGLGLGYGLRGVVGVQAAMFVAEFAAFAWMWRSGRWTGVRVSGAAAAYPTSVT
jgi:MATE family multidrug resistance protein